MKDDKNNRTKVTELKNKMKNTNQQETEIATK